MPKARPLYLSTLSSTLVSAVQMDGHCCIQDFYFNKFYGRIFKWIKHQTLVTCHLMGSLIFTPAGSFSCYNCYQFFSASRLALLLQGMHAPSAAGSQTRLRMPHVSAWSQDFKKGKRSLVKQNALCNYLFLHGCLQEAIALLELCQRSAVSFLRRAWARMTISKLSKSFAQRGNELSTTSPFALGVGPEQNSLKFDAVAKDMWLYGHATCELLLKYWRLVVWKQAGRTTKYSHNPERLDRWTQGHVTCLPWHSSCINQGCRIDT